MFYCFIEQLRNISLFCTTCLQNRGRGPHFEAKIGRMLYLCNMVYSAYHTLSLNIYIDSHTNISCPLPPEFFRFESLNTRFKTPLYLLSVCVGTIQMSTNVHNDRVQTVTLGRVRMFTGRERQTDTSRKILRSLV